MDEQSIKQALRELAEQEISDDMDLWPVLKSQIESRLRLRISPSMRVGWAFLAVLMLLTVGAAAYAISQLVTGDPGLDEASAAGLVTSLDLTQTVDGAEVTLNWAYADAHRIALSYSTSYDSAVYGELMPIHESLTDDEGHTFKQAFGGGGGGGGDSTVVFGNATHNYDASPIQGSPDQLNLHLEVDLGTPDMIPMGPGAFGGSGGGGGGGGGSAATPEVTPQVHLSEPLVFTFDFTVPFVPAIVIEPRQAVTANNLAITLNRIAITPTLTRADLCFDLPDNTTDWTPRIMLDTGEKYTVSGFLPDDEQPDARRCGTVDFLAFYDSKAAQWTLTVEKLLGPLSYTSQELQDALAARGLDVEVSPGGGFEISNVPDGVDVAEEVTAAEDSLRNTVDGPWTFTITIPGREP